MNRCHDLADSLGGDDAVGDAVLPPTLAAPMIAETQLQRSLDDVVLGLMLAQATQEKGDATAIPLPSTLGQDVALVHRRP